ncbi:bacteriophage abortive infection AbiH family protein [Paraflavitalea pollutisoli]|uniref:bacteriophage abortive infection AbiH family protein n=1 Tax=Paraflavitalea pollutisoli TaxID=3034143 RepID=UPI0023EB5C9B|nr:bacteriophage abortive infection AbiH family protein [Paraflavitalea sp. H1-2-19X]
MKKKRLYVIGNGFDIHHGIRSRYADFEQYLKENDSWLRHKLEKYLPVEHLWSDFESALECLDPDDVLWGNINSLPSYGAADWKDSGYWDYQLSVSQDYDLLTKEMKKRFTEWILQVRQFPTCVHDRMVNIARDAQYLNFNYTDTLERVYGIKEERIVYIHGKAVDTNSSLVLGHARDPKTIPPRKKKAPKDEDDDTGDWRVDEAERVIDDYWKENYKPTRKILQEHAAFFTGLKDVEEVHVLGHSMSPVDMPYFRAISEYINRDVVQWYVSYYNFNELQPKRMAFKDIRVSLSLVTFDKLPALYSPQLLLFNEVATRMVLQPEEATIV